MLDFFSKITIVISVFIAFIDVIDLKKQNERESCIMTKVLSTFKITPENYQHPTSQFI